MKRLMVFVRENLIVIGFFFFLGISLFLGDGKQSFIDVFMAGVVVVFYAFLLLSKKIKIKPFPYSLSVLWIILISYYVLGALISVSVGYSISSTMRLIEGFLVYSLFYAISDAKSQRVFVWGMVALSTLGITASVFLMGFPGYSKYLPLMNMLYPTYGHNHLADLLLLTMPFVFLNWFNKPNKLNLFLFLAFVAAMFTTVARGAWLLLFVFFIVQVIKTLKFKAVNTELRMILFTIIGLFVVGIFTSFIISFVQPLHKYLPVNFYKELVKPAPWQDIRLEYWRQAVVAISEKPLFGSGPGTFYLDSKRLEKTPLSYSWFAHGYFLQSLVELGVVGTTVLFLLFYYHLKIFWRRIKIGGHVDHSPLSKSLFWGLILTVFYSLFEYNLDYLVVWLLFMAICGLLTGSTIVIKEKHHVWTGVYLGYLGLTILTVYYLLSVSGLIASTLPTNVNASFYLSPFDTNITISYLKTGQTLGSNDIKLIRFFHKQNPEVVYALAQNYQTNAKYDNAKDLYTSALYLDPLNLDYNSQYLNLLSQRLITDGKEQKKVTFIINNIFQNSWFLPVRLYKYAVVDFLSGQKELTPKLLAAAIILDPGTSFWRVELANYHLNTGDEKEAQIVLVQCLSVSSARQHCEDYLRNNFNLRRAEPVGFLQKTIEAFFSTKSYL